MRGLSPSHRGVCAGTVLGVSKNTVRVRLRPELSSGEIAQLNLTLTLTLTLTPSQPHTLTLTLTPQP